MVQNHSGWCSKSQESGIPSGSSSSSALRYWLCSFPGSKNQAPNRFHPHCARQHSTRLASPKQPPCRRRLALDLTSFRWCCDVGYLARSSSLRGYSQPSASGPPSLFACFAEPARRARSTYASGISCQGGFDLNIRRQGSPPGRQNSRFGIEELLNLAPILSGDVVRADVPTAR